jgi:type I restriction enzyme, S subunit
MAVKRQTVTFQQLIDDGLLEIGDGYRAQNHELGGTGPIFLRAGHVTDTHIDFTGVEHFHIDLTDKLRPKMSQVGDTIITTKGNSTGRTSFVTARLPPFVYSPHLSYWRTRDPKKLCGGFLRYWSQGIEFVNQLSGMKASTDMAPYLSLTDQRRLTITLPPVAEQRAIAAILGAFDDKIELNRRMNETLEAMARALFQSWFVDFDPVRAKLDGRQPAGMDAATAALFPSSFFESAAGHIPSGWCAANLGDVIEVFDSKRVPLSGREREQRKGRYPYYGAASAMDFVDDYIFDGVYALMGEDGSVINDDGSPVMQYVWGKFWVNNHAHVLSGRGGICTEHVLLHLKGCNIAAFVTGAVQPKLNQGNMNSIPFTIPSQGIGKAFESTIEPLFARIRANTDQSRTLAALRDTLLPKLLSGELRIKEAEGFVGKNL